MVIDGPTLSRVLSTSAEGRLAALASRCSGVVVCRASPAQKAAIVRLMARYELFGEQVSRLRCAPRSGQAASHQEPCRIVRAWHVVGRCMAGHASPVQKAAFLRDPKV